MYTYTAFFIKKEFAYHYYHKSGILYRFLRNDQLHKTTDILIRQRNYITDRYSEYKLLSHLQKNCPQHVHTSENKVTITDGRQSLSLHIYEKQIEFQCETLHAAETLLFPELRRFHPFTFIIENNQQNFGWISPILLNREDKKEQVLYSHV